MPSGDVGGHHALVLCRHLGQAAWMGGPSDEKVISQTKGRRRQVTAPPSPLSFEAIFCNDGKRARTRALLLDATTRLIASHDPGDIAIYDITKAAGLANGTFYYHFSDKSEVIAETAIRIARQMGGRIYQAGIDIDDPVEKLAAATRRLVYFCVKHPTWALALGRAVNYLPSLRPQLYSHMRITFLRGIEEGDFHVEDSELVLDTLVAMSFSAARAGLEGLDPEEAGRTASEMQLRALGVPPARARRAACKMLEPMKWALSDWNEDMPGIS